MSLLRPMNLFRRNNSVAQRFFGPTHSHMGPYPAACTKECWALEPGRLVLPLSAIEQSQKALDNAAALGSSAPADLSASVSKLQWHAAVPACRFHQPVADHIQ